jgi:hypothetical protein
MTTTMTTTTTTTTTMTLRLETKEERNVTRGISYAQLSGGKRLSANSAVNGLLAEWVETIASRRSRL